MNDTIDTALLGNDIASSSIMMNEWIMSALIWFWIFMNIIFVVSFLLKAWWLWNINKKTWESYPWLAWIPVIQIYAFVKASWKDTIWILWLILWFLFFMIPWIVIYIMLCNWISKRTNRWIWSTIWIIFIPWIMLPIIWYKLKDWKSKVENTKTEL